MDMVTGWKIIPKSAIEGYKSYSGLSVPGLAPDEVAAILLVTVRPLQGIEGLGTISSMMCSESVTGQFALAHFTNNIIDKVNDLPEYFLSSEGAAKRDHLYHEMLDSLMVIRDRYLLFFWERKYRQFRFLVNESRRFAAEAANKREHADYLNHLRLIHLAIDRQIEARSVLGETRDYAEIVGCYTKGEDDQRGIALTLYQSRNP